MLGSNPIYKAEFCDQFCNEPIFLWNLNDEEFLKIDSILNKLLI
jgi:hypothetical protein